MSALKRVVETANSSRGAIGRTRPTLVVIAALIATAVSPAWAAPSPINCVSASGYVRDAYGSPLAGATVTTSPVHCGEGASTTTDAAGRYRVLIPVSATAGSEITASQSTTQSPVRASAAAAASKIGFETTRQLVYANLDVTEPLNDFRLPYLLAASLARGALKSGETLEVSATSTAPVPGEGLGARLIAQLPDQRPVPLDQRFTDATTGATAWNGAFNAEAVEGRYALKVCGVDQHFDGNCDAAASAGGSSLVTRVRPLEYIVDNTPPTLTGLTPAPTTNTQQARPLLAALAGDAGSGLNIGSQRIILDDAIVQTGTLRFTPASDLSLGLHHVRVEAADQAGNVAVREWQFNRVSFDLPLRGSVSAGSQLSKSFAAAQTSVTFAAVPVAISTTEFSLSSAIRPARGSLNVAVPRNFTVTFNGPEGTLPQSAKETRPDLRFTHSFAQLAPSAGAIAGGIHARPLDAGPITVEVPAAYRLTGGTAKLELDTATLKYSFSSDDPMPNSLECTGETNCEVAGVVHCGFDLAAPTACTGTRPEVHLTAGGVRVGQVLGSRSPQVDQGAAWSTTRPRPPDPNPVNGGCFQPDGLTTTCSDALDNATHRTDWAAGQPFDPLARPLFGAYGNHRYYRIVTSDGTERLAAWQQSDVHPGASPCAPGSLVFATTELLHFAQSVEATRGWLPGVQPVFAATAAANGTKIVEQRLPVSLSAATADGAPLYRVDNYADVAEVAGPPSYALNGAFTVGTGEAYRASWSSASAAVSVGLESADGGWNRWEPTGSARTQPVELMTGSDWLHFAEGGAASAGIFFKFAYNNSACLQA